MDRVLGHGEPPVLPHGRLEREEARRLDARGHVGEGELDGLELGDDLSEGHPLFGVPEGRLVGALSAAEGERGDGDAPAVEDLERVREPVPHLAQAVLVGEEAVLEDELARIGGAEAELVLLLAVLEARRPLLHDEGGAAVVRVALVGEGDDHGDVAHRGVGAEGLGPVEDPAVALADRRGLEASGVGPGARLREGPRADGSCPRRGG